MHRNRITKRLLGGLLAVAMLLGFLPTLVAPAAVAADGLPTWYVSYLGGSGATDSGAGIAVDDTGNTYIAGRTNSENFPTTPGAYQTTSGGGNDAFVAKFDSSGNLVYSTYFGGSGSDYGNGIALDETGNIYITGQTSSANFPTTPGAYQTANAGGTDGFVAKFDSGGNLVYSTYLGGSGSSDYGLGIAVDNTGNSYITGQTNSANFPTTPGAYQTTSGGGTNDAFVAKFDSGGNLVYSTYLGGTGTTDYGYGIAVDSAGNIYITGRTNSANFPTTPGAYQTTKSGTYDAFVTKFDSGGNLVYSTYLGGSGSTDYGYGISVDETGNIYITGYTNSADFPTTPGAYQTTSGGGTYDAFVTKFDSGGNLVYSTYLGGSANFDYGFSIAVDETGNIYITGRTDSADFPITPGAYQTTYATETDAFVTKFDSGGNLVYSTYLGGTKTEYGYSIAVDNTRNIYVSGYTSSADLPITPDAYQTTNAAAPGDISYDAFFASMTTATTPPTYTITASAGANGTIDPSGDVVVNEGDNVTFTITPATGYHVADVLVDAVSAGAVTSYTFTNVTAAHTIEASFAIDTFTITASAGANGSIDPVGDVTVNYGDNQTFAISANTGYHIADVLVDAVSVGAVTSYEFTSVTANHTISVSFALDCPEWDLNGDHVCNIGDVVVIGLKWGQTGTPGWIPEDVNDDGTVNIGDVVVLGLHWGETW